MDVNNLNMSEKSKKLALTAPTLAWLDSSNVSERRLTSGRFTAPRVTPELTYRTRASPTVQVSTRNKNGIIEYTFGTNSSLSLFSTASDVWGKNDILQAAKVLCPGVEFRGEVITISTWFTWVDIQCGTCNLTTAGGVDESWNVNNCTTAGIDQVASLLHLLELGRSDHVLGLG